MLVFTAAAIFLIAGFVKGVSGLGQHIVAMGLLSLTMPPREAAALLLVPALVTNLWQVTVGPQFTTLILRLWPMLATICMGTLAGVGLLVQDQTGWTSLALGGTLVIYAAFGLANRRLQIPGSSENWLSPLIGAATGIVSGATGVFSVPAVPYLQSLRLDKEQLVQALALSFTTSTLALAAGLVHHGMLQGTLAGTSIAALIPSLAGVLAGQWVRRRMRVEIFQLLFFAALIGLGTDLIFRALG